MVELSKNNFFGNPFSCNICTFAFFNEILIYVTTSHVRADSNLSFKTYNKPFPFFNQNTISCLVKDLKGKYQLFTIYRISKGIHSNFI